MGVVSGACNILSAISFLIATSWFAAQVFMDFQDERSFITQQTQLTPNWVYGYCLWIGTFIWLALITCFFYFQASWFSHQCLAWRYSSASEARNLFNMIERFWLVTDSRLISLIGILVNLIHHVINLKFWRYCEFKRQLVLDFSYQ